MQDSDSENANLVCDKQLTSRAPTIQQQQKTKQLD